MPPKSVVAALSLVLLTACGPSGIDRYLYSAPFPTPEIDAPVPENWKETALKEWPPGSERAVHHLGGDPETIVDDSLAFPHPVDEVLEASGYSVFLDGEKIALKGYGYILPTTSSEAPYGDVSGYVSLDSDPISHDQEVGLMKEFEYYEPDTYLFVLEVPYDWDHVIERQDWIHCDPRFPMNRRIEQDEFGGLRIDTWPSSIALNFYCVYPVPGPAILSLDIWHNPGKPHSERKEGENPDVPSFSRLTRVIFKIPDVKGMPEANRGVLNILDVTYPLLDFEDMGMDCEEFLAEVLADNYVERYEWGKGLGPVTYTNKTVRDILNDGYPEGWPLKSKW